MSNLIIRWLNIEGSSHGNIATNQKQLIKQLIMFDLVLADIPDKRSVFS